MPASLDCLMRTRAVLHKLGPCPPEVRGGGVKVVSWRRSLARAAANGDGCGHARPPRGAVALHTLFCTVVAFLIYGALVYLLTRTLCYVRKSRHTREPAAEIEAILGREDSALLTILIPSFKEDPRVVQRTLLSAAFQTY